MAVKFEKVSDNNYMLDVTGYVCPVPQMYAKKVLEKLNKGDHVKVMVNNPSSHESISQFCTNEDHPIVNTTLEKGVYTIEIVK